MPCDAIATKKSQIRSTFQFLKLVLFPPTTLQNTIRKQIPGKPPPPSKLRCCGSKWVNLHRKPVAICAYVYGAHSFLDIISYYYYTYGSNGRRSQLFLPHSSQLVVSPAQVYCAAWRSLKWLFVRRNPPFPLLISWSTMGHFPLAQKSSVFAANVRLHEFMTWITTSYLCRYGKPLVILTGDNRNTSHWSPAGFATYSTTTNLWTCHLFIFIWLLCVSS